MATSGVIQHNIPAMNAYRNYTANSSALAKNLRALSSGLRINSAADDAAGLAISEKMRAQITGLSTAQKNAKDGISLVQTAEGALTEVHDMLNRMYTLAEQSANGTYSDDVDREQIQKEIDSLTTEINRISKATNFNGIQLLDGSKSEVSSKFAVSTTDFAEGGLVKGAFTVASTAASPVVGSNTILRGEATEDHAGSFQVDLSELCTAVCSASTAQAAYKVKVGSAAFVIQAASQGKNLNIMDMSGGNIKTSVGNTNAAVFYMTAGGFHVATSTTSIAKGAIIYSAAMASGVITFKAIGAMKAAGVVASEMASFADDSDAWSYAAASAAAVGLEMAVTSVGATHATLANSLPEYNPLTTEINQTTKAGSTLWAQAPVSMQMSKIQDGTTWTIGDTTYTFALGPNSAYADASNVIDLTGIDQLDGIENLSFTKIQEACNNNATTAASVANKIMDAISNLENDYFTVGVTNVTTGGTTFGKINISEKINDDGTPAITNAEWVSKLKTKVLDTNGNINADGIASLFTTMRNPATLGSQTVTGTGLTSGDTLTINGKGYTFTTDSSLKVKDGFVQIGSDDAASMENLKKAINARDSSLKVSVDDNKLTIYDNASTGEKKTIQGKGLTLQIGDTADYYNQLNVTIKAVNSESLGLDGIKVTDQDSALAAMSVIKNAINYVSDVRGDLGATQNRLEHTINNLSVTQENIQDAESTIRDTDVAAMMMEYTKNSIKVQAAQAMLAQANQLPQGLLQMLG